VGQVTWKRFSCCGVLARDKGNFSPSVQVPSDSNPMEMLGLTSQEGGGIGDELTASEEALRFGWASWAIHGLFKKLTDCGDAS
jgi:hypothetical protein